MLFMMVDCHGNYCNAKQGLIAGGFLVLGVCGRQTNTHLTGDVMHRPEVHDSTNGFPSLTYVECSFRHLPVLESQWQISKVDGWAA